MRAARKLPATGWSASGGKPKYCEPQWSGGVMRRNLNRGYQKRDCGDWDTLVSPTLVNLQLSAFSPHPFQLHSNTDRLAHRN